MCRCLSLHVGMCRYIQVSQEASVLDPLGLVWWLWDAGSQTPVLEEQQASCPLNHLSSPKNYAFFFFFWHSLFVKQRSYFQTLITRPSQISYMCSHVYSNFSALFLWLPTHPNIFHLFGFCDRFLVVSRVKGLFILEKGIKVDFLFSAKLTLIFLEFVDFHKHSHTIGWRQWTGR